MIIIIGGLFLRFSRDSRGFAFSLDVLLALIPLTIILGMAVANMDNINYLSENTIFQSSLDRTAADAADALVESPGTPLNWEAGGNIYTPGLARYDFSKNATQKNVLAPSKVGAINTTLLQNLIGPDYGAYLTITVANESNATVIKTVGTYNNTAPNIVRMERLVSTSKLDFVTSMEGLIRDAGQPRTYTTTFPTNYFSVTTFDYWVIVVNNGYNSANVQANSNVVIPSNEFSQHIDLIKKQINPGFLFNQTNFQDNVISVRTVSNPGSTMDVYVIAAPKGTPASDITLDRVKLRNAKLVLYVWTR
jgi:hypothetical protein